MADEPTPVEQAEGEQPQGEMDAKAIGHMKMVKERMQRLIFGPGGSVLFHIVLVAVIVSFAGSQVNTYAPTMEVEMKADELKAEPVEIQEEIHKMEEPIPPEPTETEVSDSVSDTYSVSDPTLTTEGTGIGGETVGIGSGLGAEVGFEVSAVKSPLTMRGLYAGRTSAGRKGALDKYGGGHGNATEGAVLRALRWLKKEQAADGSWPTPQPAMTSWALLCYLAHGETPASQEFGPTVEKAIKYLASTQASWPKSYQWQIATYALCEAYGMTKIPMLKDVAYAGLDGVIKGQTATGGWRYGLAPTDEGGDTSVMGWCAQAIKAAKLAGVEHEGLDNCIKQAVKGFKANAAPAGGFGYCGPGGGGLTGVGVLCMQLLGYAKEAECRNGLQVLEASKFDWEDAGGGDPLYYWYYITQAKFHAGGDTWNSWNKQCAPQLVRNQIVLKGAGIDGKDIGYWETPRAAGQSVKGHSTGLVYNTTLCCLMLEVYYRYLPTYKSPDEIKADDAGGGQDIKIEISK